MIQRLFSMFPNSWPGAALVLLRLSVSSGVAIDTIHIEATANAVSLVFMAAVWASIALIIVGLWTPIASGAVALAELLATFVGPPSLFIHALISAIAASLMILGPGAWSIDAFLYGRKRLI